MKLADYAKAEGIMGSLRRLRRQREVLEYIREHCKKHGEEHSLVAAGNSVMLGDIITSEELTKKCIDIADTKILLLEEELALI